MFINYRDLTGIQQSHLGHSGGAGADSQPLIPTGRGGVKPSHLYLKWQRGPQPCPHCPYWKQGRVFKRLWLSEAERGCPKCTGSIKKSLAKTAPCALPSEMFAPLRSDSQAGAQGMALDVWELLEGPGSAEQPSLRDWGPLFNTLCLSITVRLP